MTRKESIALAKAQERTALKIIKIIETHEKTHNDNDFDSIKDAVIEINETANDTITECKYER